jgi:predicted metal-binding membrane protein
MVMLLALGVMSVAWMAVIAAFILVQKLVSPKPGIDLPLALAIVGLGVLIVLAPASVPGLMPPM